jgi:hypothetical protein
MQGAGLAQSVLLGYKLNERVIAVRFPAEVRNSLSHRVQTSSVAHPVSYLIVTGDSFSEVKRPGREDDHSRPSSAEAKSGGAIRPLPHTHRDKFIF